MSYSYFLFIQIRPTCICTMVNNWESKWPNLWSKQPIINKLVWISKVLPYSSHQESFLSLTGPLKWGIVWNEHSFAWVTTFIHIHFDALCRGHGLWQPYQKVAIIHSCKVSYTTYEISNASGVIGICIFQISLLWAFIWCKLEVSRPIFSNFSNLSRGGIHMMHFPHFLNLLYKWYPILGHFRNLLT